MTHYPETYIVEDSFGRYSAQLVNVDPKDLYDLASSKVFAIALRDIPNHLRESFITRNKWNAESDFFKIPNEEYERLKQNVTEKPGRVLRMVFHLYTKEQYQRFETTLEHILMRLEQEVK